MKFKGVKICWIALLLFIISGCSNKPERPEPEGFFATHTDEDGIRLFQYSLDVQASTNGKRGPNGASQPGKVGGHVAGSSSRGVSGGLTMGSTQGKRGRKTGGKGRVDSYQRITDKLENLLEQELKLTDYCPQGYTELERMIGASEAFIKGECNEVSSAEHNAVSLAESK